VQSQGYTGSVFFCEGQAVPSTLVMDPPRYIQYILSSSTEKYTAIAILRMVVLHRYAAMIATDCVTHSDGEFG
jgi:hypothetical protein